MQVMSAQRGYVELTPSGAEQSATRDGNEGTYGADRAIDGDIDTGTMTAGGIGQWFKVMLDGMPCVREVKWYYQSKTPETSWTCTGDSCVCSGSYCSWASMAVATIGDYATPFDSDCEYGNSVKFTFNATWFVSFSEIKITGNTGEIVKLNTSINIWLQTS